jgi:hypothetical protein
MKTIIFPIMAYDSESWTLNSSCQRRIEAFEMFAYRRMFPIHWIDHRTNISIIQQLKIQAQHCLVTIQSQILKSFGHVLEEIVMKRTLSKEKSKEREAKAGPIRYIDQMKTLTQMTISESIQNTGNIEFWRNVSNRKNTIA